jgi:hypothetical protein
MKKCIRCYDDEAVNSAGHCVKCTAELETWTQTKTGNHRQAREPSPSGDLAPRLERLVPPQTFRRLLP